MTFTEAAAAELKERIRAVLGTMLDAATGAEPASERERLLLERAAEAGVPREACAGLLKNALSSFDDAAISTIHGFCARVLGENAFESGVLFPQRTRERHFRHDRGTRHGLLPPHLLRARPGSSGTQWPKRPESRRKA